MIAVRPESLVTMLLNGWRLWSGIRTMAAQEAPGSTISPVEGKGGEASDWLARMAPCVPIFGQEGYPGRVARDCLTARNT